jgi:hypothetical protein
MDNTDRIENRIYLMDNTPQPPLGKRGSKKRTLLLAKGGI